MSRRLSVVIDDELDKLLAAHAADRGIVVSAAVRDLLRHALAIVANENDAGWREGRSEAWAAIRKAIAEAVQTVPATAPTTTSGGVTAR